MWKVAVRKAAFQIPKMKYEIMRNISDKSHRKPPYLSIGMSRRTTLGGLSSSAVNARASRASLGPARVSSDLPAKSRASIAVAPATGRKSSGAPLPASRRSSTGVGVQPRYFILNIVMRQ